MLEITMVIVLLMAMVMVMVIIVAEMFFAIVVAAGMLVLIKSYIELSLVSKILYCIIVYS